VIKAKLEQALGVSLNKVQAQDEKDQVRRVDRPPRQGSIIVVIATDLPLVPHQLQLLTNRAALGIGAMGSTMDTTSGDGVIAFSTAVKIPLNQTEKIEQPGLVHPDALSPVYRATVEAVTEAQINALLASHRENRS
jgi:D-aminopeptidase